jgi:hypothetical protein
MTFRAWMRTPRGVGSAVVLVLSFAVGFLPLFAGPGYEHAIASGLIVPTVAAIVAANEGYADRRRAVASPLAAMVRSLISGLCLSAIALATALIHGVRVGFCDPLGGVATFLLTAAMGAVLASAIGATIAIAAAHFGRMRRLAAVLAGLAPLASAIVAGAFFYFTPAVFAFDPFVGFFSGTLYDEVVDAWRPLLSYRAGTALTVAALFAFVASLDRDETGRVRVADRPRALAFLLFAAASVALITYGPALGHRSSAASIRRELGGSRSGPRCEVVYPRSLSEREVELLVRDCEEALVAVEKRIGFRGPERITAFFFKDSAQKRALMGAADTYVAKPWRREVYLQVAPYPHPVLGHEIAHVVAGEAARGPFRVAGRFAGLIPNPGLIEGIAVAASPDKDELTPAQWARAMKQIGILPKLSRTFGGGFLAQNSSMAYTVAGSFVSYLQESGKRDAVRAWYGGAPFESAFGMSFSDAEALWLRALDDAALPPEALAVARARFDRPAIWGRECPHVVEKLRDEAEECRDAGDLATADDKLRKLLKLDEVDAPARIERAKLALRRGDEPAHRSILEELIGDARVSLTWRNRAREALGDEALRRLRLDEAHALYEVARREVLDDDWARNLDVKAFMATSDARARLFGRLIVGRAPAHENKDETLAATIAIARAIEQSTTTGDDLALARYLIARRLIDAHAWEDADAVLATIDLDALGHVTPRAVREAARLSIVIACMGERATRGANVATALARFRAAPRGNEGRHEAIERLADRCVQ